MEITRVLLLASDLETWLRMRGGIGSGIASLTHSLDGELPIQFKTRLLALSSMRNRFVHQPESALEIHMERFCDEATALKHELLAWELQLAQDEKEVTAVGLETFSPPDFIPPSRPPPPPQQRRFSSTRSPDVDIFGLLFFAMAAALLFYWAFNGV